MMLDIHQYKWIFLAVSSAISFLVGRKLAILETQYHSCELSVKDRFINNILHTNVNLNLSLHLRGLGGSVSGSLQSPNQQQIGTQISASQNEISGRAMQSYIFYNPKENSALTSVFTNLHHPAYPTDGEFILSQENFWNDDFSTCQSVYLTRSGARVDDSQPTTCEAVVRVPSDHGDFSNQAISHRNGSTKFPQVLKDQYQEDTLKPYTMPRQHEWVNAFMSKYTELMDLFRKEVGDPFDEANPNKRRTLIVMVANEGVLDFILNFMCSAVAAKINVEDVVVFLGQEEYVELIHAMGAKAFYHPTLGYVPRQAAASYADRTFTKLMWMKITSVYVALNAGFNVIFQDTDLVWIKDPTSYFHSMPYDMAFMDDGARTMRFGPLFTNTGFYFTRYGAKTIYLFERLIRSAGEIDFTASHQATFIRHLVETYFLYAIPIFILDEREFPSGQMYHHQKQYVTQVKHHVVTPYVWHMCWTDHRGQKIQYFQDIGMWFLQESNYENGMCENGQEMLNWLRSESNRHIIETCCVTGTYWKT